MQLYNRFLLKKVFLLGFLMVIANLNAQPYYYSASFLVNDGNPGILNTEQDNLLTGWTNLIAGSQTANTWSSINPIPSGFDFDFFGTPVTNAKISGNGVLTFDVSATAIPSNTNTNLPATSSNIPNNSILAFWDSFTGDGAIGSTDLVVYKVFGTAPNRQVWFKYSNYEYGDNGSGGNVASYAYWAIVLEETTHRVYILDMDYSNDGDDLTATIGLQENSSRAIQYGIDDRSMNDNIQASEYNNDVYAFTPILLDSNDISIIETFATPIPYSTGLQNVEATIKNVGANPIVSVDINWKVNGILQTPYNYTGNLEFLDSLTLPIGTFNFPAGGSTIEMWTTNPNGIQDGNTTNDSLLLNVCTGISGTFTVGIGGDYPSIDSVAYDLNTCGVLGPVTFNVSPGTYSGSITLGQIQGASATNTITINGGSADLVSITYNGQGSSSSVITLDGTDYITLKNLTIQNTSLISNGKGVFLTNSANENTIDSCKISVNTFSSSADFIPIMASANPTSIVTNSAGDNVNNLTISNSDIIGGYYGVVIVGSDVSTPNNSQNKLINCQITDVYYYGIYFENQDSPTISGNTVDSPRSNSGGYSCRVSGKEPIVTKNNFHGARSTGLYLLNCNLPAQSFTQNGLVANNMITTIGASEGIYLSSSLYINIYNNSVISDNQSALRVGTGSAFLNIRNNILEGDHSNPYYSAIDFDYNLNGTSVIDYNIYNSVYVASIGSSHYTSLTAWTAADPLQNANSFEGDPGFIAANNLHLAGSIAESAGTPITLVSDDVDGDVRSTVSPDIGADEYTFCPSPTGFSSVNVNLNSTQVSWIGGGTETAWNIEYGNAGFSQGSGTQVLGITNPNYILTPLTSNNGYHIYIQADCSGSGSYWAGPFSFTSACQAFVAPYTESFITNTTPTCWSQSAISGGPWEFLTASGPSTPCGSKYDHTPNLTSRYAYVDHSSSDAGVVLTMNNVDISALTVPFLEFYYSQCGLNMSAMNDLFIEAWNGITWVQVALVNDATGGDWRLYEFNLTNYIYNSNLVKLRFRSESGGDALDFNGDIYIDDISILEGPICPMPSGLNANILNSSTVELSWTPQGMETEWSIEYGTVGFPLGSGIQINNVMSNVDTISGFLVNTPYEFYVKAECGVGGSSIWAGPYQYIFEFCTPAPTSSSGGSISQVMASSINNSTGTEPGNYADYTYLSTDVNQGGTQAFYIKFITSSVAGVNIWIDWNNDLVFNSSELVYTGASTSSFPFDITATFAIPSTASLGSHTMRIGGAQQFSGPGNPCYSGSNATFEDYTVNVVPACAINIVDSHTACGSYTWRDGITYTSSNSTATDSIFSVNGGTCDTIYTLDLTINNSVSSVDTQEACDEFTWINGVTYFTSNFTAVETLTTNTGCDSIITLNLVINNSMQNTDVITACETYTWIDGVTYTASTNSAIYTGTLSNGCDSIVILDLTITNPDESITQTDGIYLISNQPGASYRWLDCDNGYTVIGGAINQLFIASSNGDYAVEVTYLSCIDTSACISVSNVGLDDVNTTFANVYPNPVNDILTITFNDLDNAQFELMDLQGKIVISSTTIINGQKVDVSSLESGIYFVRLTSDDNRMIKRIVKN